MQQIADVHQDSASFHFDALVRGLCSSASLHAHLASMREHVLAKRHNARAILDMALQSLVPSIAPLEDKTNTARYVQVLATTYAFSGVRHESFCCKAILILYSDIDVC